MKSKVKILRIGALLGTVCLLAGVAAMTPRWRMEARFASGMESSNTIVIDAGHGGFDGGAVSRNGTAEKDINLAIALELQRLAEIDGWNVVMTRTEDVALDDGDEERKRIRTRKTEDLRARKAIIDQTEPRLAVSIHLNSFQEDRSVRGAQTFYPSRGESEQILEESRTLAEIVQKHLVEGVDDGIRRDAMGKADVLLLKDPKVPVILVECGFLSNAADETNLKNPEYQRKLSEFIYNGIMEFSEHSRAETLFVLDSGSPLESEVTKFPQNL